MSSEDWLADLPADAPAPAEELLLALPRRGEHGAEDEFRVAIRVYESHPYVDLRVWHSDRSGWRPGKGVTVKVREVGEVAKAMAAAARKLRGGT